MHKHLTGRLSFYLKWPLHTTAPFFIADVTVKSRLFICTNHTHTRKAGFSCVHCPTPILVGEKKKFNVLTD